MSDEIKTRCPCGSDTFGRLDIIRIETGFDGKPYAIHLPSQDGFLAICTKCTRVHLVEFGDSGMVFSELPVSSK